MGDDIVYNSSSPDEIALTNFAKYCGYEYRGKTGEEEMILRVGTKESKIKLLYELEFTSARYIAC